MKILHGGEGIKIDCARPLPLAEWGEWATAHLVSSSVHLMFIWSSLSGPPDAEAAAPLPDILSPTESVQPVVSRRRDDIADAQYANRNTCRHRLAGYCRAGVLQLFALVEMLQTSFLCRSEPRFEEKPPKWSSLPGLFSDGSERRRCQWRSEFGVHGARLETAQRTLLATCASLQQHHAQHHAHSAEEAETDGACA